MSRNDYRVFFKSEIASKIIPRYSFYKVINLTKNLLLDKFGDLGDAFEIPYKQSIITHNITNFYYNGYHEIFTYNFKLLEKNAVCIVAVTIFLSKNLMQIDSETRGRA